MTKTEKSIVHQVLSRVINAMQKDDDGEYIDGGNFCIKLSEDQLNTLKKADNDIYYK